MDRVQRIPDFMSGLAAPAIRALVANKLTTLKKLSVWSREEVLALHGIGKSAMPVLEKALSGAGLSFRELRPGTPVTVQEYISGFPQEVKKRLNQIRKIVLSEAPDVQERIGYGMPYYKLNGMLLYFAAHTAHIGLYPMPSAISEFRKELTGYVFAKGSIQFPNDKPLPLNLIRSIVAFRVEENRSGNPFKKK